MVKRYSGRRSQILFDKLGIKNNNTDVIWYLILGLAVIYVLIGAIVITDAIIAPKYHEKKRGSKHKGRK